MRKQLLVKKISILCLFLLIFCSIAYSFFDDAGKANKYMERFEKVINRLEYRPYGEYFVPHKFFNGEKIEPYLTENLENILGHLEKISENITY